MGQVSSSLQYFTTSFELTYYYFWGQQIYNLNYCHLVVTNAFLDDPDDGTTEKKNGQLAIANNRGHK